MPKRDKKDPKCFYLPSDVGEAEGLAEDARHLWVNRDARMQRDQWVYELRRAPAKKGEVREQINDCAVQIDAADDLMSSVDMQINVVTDETSEADVAQQAEDLDRHIWFEWDRRYRRQGRPGLLTDMCHDLNLYGWLIPRLTLDGNDKKCPWSIELLDPRRVYLDKPDGKPNLVVYYTQLSSRDIALTWDVKTLHRVRPDADPDDTDNQHDVIHYHTDKETAVSIGGEWLKKPTLHEYPWGNPVFVMLAGGTTHRGPLPGGDLIDAQFDTTTWDERVGTGFLQNIRPVAEDGQRIADLSAELLGLTARPPTIDKVRQTKITEPIVGVGAHAVMTPEESHEQHPPPAQALQYNIQLRQERANAIAMAGLNPVILGGGEAQAAADRFLLSAAGARTLRKRMDTLGMTIALLMEACLAAYQKWSNPVSYVTTDRATGGRKIVTQLKPWMLKPDLLRVEVQFGEIGVPDLQARMTTAAMGVREGLISQYYALANIIKVPNPAQVIAESQRDQCWKIPQFVQMMGLVQMAKDPTDPIAGAVAMELLPASVARLTELARPPQPPGPQPGQGPPPGPPGAPPMPPPGMQGPPLPGVPLPSTPQVGVPTAVQSPAMVNGAAGPNAPLPPGMMPPGAALPQLG